jgi:hypothetical protein
MAFEVSSFRQDKLSKPGFLADGLCIFGDNAYVNTKHMATPYPNVGSNRQKDAYNFYHSQLRITVEGCFGIFTQRFGFLRKPAPKKYTVKKTMMAVSAMARLHNYLIEIGDRCSIDLTEEDRWNLAVNGAVPYSMRDGIRVPLQLLDGGDHFDDDPTRQRRDRTHNETILPHEALLHIVNEKNLHRPR